MLPVRHIGLAVAAILHRADVLERIRRESSPCQPLVRRQLWEDGIGRQQDAVSPFAQVDDTPVEGLVASHDVMDVVEGRRIELHDAVPNGLLVDALIQGLELSPELHQVAAARARVRLHARRRSEDVPGQSLCGQEAMQSTCELTEIRVHELVFVRA